MTVFQGFDEAVVVDVETTGLDPANDRVITVAMARGRFADLKDDSSGLHFDTMDAIVNPEVRIPAGASRVHGITNRAVVDKGTFAEVAQQLRDFIGDRPIIAHNASFDKRFLNAEFKRAGVKTLAGNKGFCTMHRFQDFNHGLRKGSNLDNAAEVMGVKGRATAKHDAVEDVRMTMEIAALFYMMDNGIEIPGGAPKPPRKKRKPRQYDYDYDDHYDDYDNDMPLVSYVIVGAIVIVFLVWAFA